MRRAEVMGPPLLMELLPWLAEQTADWEGAASAGAPTNPPMQVCGQLVSVMAQGDTGSHCMCYTSG